MDGLSPFECVLGHKAEICPALEIIPEDVATGTFKIYHTALKKQLAYLKNTYKISGQRRELLNKDREYNSLVLVS